MICTSNQILGSSNQGRWYGLRMWHAWKLRNTCQILVVKHEGKVQLASLMHRCENNTKMDVGE